MDAIRNFYGAPPLRTVRVLPMNTDRDRVISVSLSEAEWQAFVARHPQPVNWLREQILGQLRDSRSKDFGEGPSTPAPPVR